MTNVLCVLELLLACCCLCLKVDAQLPDLPRLHHPLYLAAPNTAVSWLNFRRKWHASGSKRHQDWIGMFCLILCLRLQYTCIHKKSCASCLMPLKHRIIQFENKHLEYHNLTFVLVVCFHRFFYLVEVYMYYCKTIAYFAWHRELIRTSN